MLWIIRGHESHEIISCNTFAKEGKYQIWVERPNGKTMKIGESENREEINEIKDAIDFAIRNGHKTLELN